MTGGFDFRGNKRNSETARREWQPEGVGKKPGEATSDGGRVSI